MNIIEEIIKEFNVKPIEEILKEFKVYDYEKQEFRNSYNYEGNFYNEEWKQIPKFNYEVSNYGRIRNITTKKLKTLKFQAYGMQVVLYKNSIGYTFTISNLVYRMFNGKLKQGEIVRHKDKNIRNNYYKNLIKI